MKFEYDSEVDALYIRIEETEIVRTEELKEGINLDFNSQDRLVGIEILNALERYNPSDIFTISTEALVLTEQKG